MKLQDNFIKLKTVTEHFVDKVNLIKSRASDQPPKDAEYFINQYSDKPGDLLDIIYRAIEHAKAGSEAAEKPDVVNANKMLENFEKCLSQLSEKFKNDIDGPDCAHYKALVKTRDQQGQDKVWIDYTAFLVDAIEEGQKGLKEIWSAFKELNTELREQSTITLSHPVLLRSEDFFPDESPDGLKQSNAERFYNMLSSLSADSGGTGAGNVPTTFSSGIVEQDATAIINSTMSTIFGSSLSPTVSGEDKKHFSEQVKKTLNRFLARKEENGQVRYELQQGFFGPATPIAGKEITGRQATLYQLAKTIQQSSKELIKSLEPISSDTDEQDIVFLKESINTSYIGVVEEFGRVAGPVSERVDSLLLTIKSELQSLKQKLGITDIKVIRDHELKDMEVAFLEQTLSNFTLLEDYCDHLSKTWEGDNETTSKLANASGTIIAKLTNIVQSIPGTVSQVNWAMDVSGFGQADRDATPLEYSGSQTTIGSALKWISVYSSQDAYPRLRDRDARLSELRAFETSFNQQILLVDKIIEKMHPFRSKQGFAKIQGREKEFTTPILGTPKVMRALFELHQSLLYAHTLVEKVVCQDKRTFSSANFSHVML